MIFNYSSHVVSPKLGVGDDIVHTSILKDGSLLAVLADGATGSGDGRMAANTFVQSCIDRIHSFDISDDDIAESFSMADQQIQSTRLYADTTGIVLLIKDGAYRCASVGDSECWMDSPDGHVSITAHQRRKPRIGSGSHRPSVNGGMVTGVIVIGSDGLFMAYQSIADIFLMAAESRNNKASAIAKAAEARHSVLPDDLSVIVILQIGNDFYKM